MSFRGGGRGRGRGRGGGGFFTAKQEPFLLFPEGVDLPEVPSVDGATEERALISLNIKLLNYWKSSPYYLEDAALTKNLEPDIERFSDRAKPKRQTKREALAYHMKLSSNNFPMELIQGSRQVQHDQRNVRWNPESGFERLDIIEADEKRSQEQDGKAGKEKKEGEDEEEEDNIEEEDDEYSDDGDYNQHIDFDDDEDDFNMDDGGGGDDDNVY